MSDTKFLIAVTKEQAVLLADGIALLEPEHDDIDEAEHLEKECAYLEALLRGVGRRATQIVWDLDNDGIECAHLPTSADVPSHVPDDEITDWLSDTYHWCVISYVLER